MAGKGGKGLLAAKTTAAKSTDKDKDKDKKKAPVSRSSRAGLQVPSRSISSPLLSRSSLPCLSLY
jgi:histone H2A